jgi:pre-mRNA-splicing helicase BRR2
MGSSGSRVDVRCPYTHTHIHTQPAYTAVAANPEQKRPAIVFVPSRKQARLTALEFVTHALAEDKPHQFLQCSPEDLASYLSVIQDASLVETLKHGIAYYHENLSAAEKKAVETLFREGAVRVLVASRETCWGMALAAHTVVLMGSQYYDGKEHRYADYPIADVLQMVGRAGRPGKDVSSELVLLCHATKKEYYKKFLFEALPIESHLDHALHDNFNAEIVTRTIENKQARVPLPSMYRARTRDKGWLTVARAQLSGCRRVRLGACRTRWTT